MSFWAAVRKTMATLDRLERYEGHLLNWYDTRTLQPLLPRYVSTVDSGNLLASLWVLERGCQDLAACPADRASRLAGTRPIRLSTLREVYGGDPSLTMPLQALRRLLRGSAEGHVLISRLRLASNAVHAIAGRRTLAGAGR